MKREMIIALTVVIIVMLIIGFYILFSVIVFLPPSAQEYCEKDSDCACGIHVETLECFFGNKNYVDETRVCPDFCTGIDGSYNIKCIKNKCEQVE